MIAETTAYRLLSNDVQLNELFDSYRGGKFGGGFKQGIFTYDIPEKPTNMKKKELVPEILDAVEDALSYKLRTEKACDVKMESGSW